MGHLCMVNSGQPALSLPPLATTMSPLPTHSAKLLQDKSTWAIRCGDNSLWAPGTTCWVAQMELGEQSGEQVSEESWVGGQVSGWAEHIMVATEGFPFSYPMLLPPLFTLPTCSLTHLPTQLSIGVPPVSFPHSERPMLSCPATTWQQ